MIKQIIKFILPFRYEETKLICYFRMSKFFNRKGLSLLCDACRHKIQSKYSCIISPNAEIGSDIKIPHPVGIVIGEGVVIGDNVTIYQNVTLGRKNKEKGEYPRIDDNVIIYSNAVVAGDVHIKKNTIIGANSVVITDTEEKSVYAGVPATRIK